jgi:glycine oxidase
MGRTRQLAHRPHLTTRIDLDYDTLIVGQGLAGSLLAAALQRRGQRVGLIDNHWQGAASIAAAGLINPVTGQRLVMSDPSGTLLPAAMRTYQRLEQAFAVQLFHPRPMLRLIRNAKEITQLDKRLGDAAYRPLLGDLLTPEQLDCRIRAPLGAVPQFQAGFVDLPLLLKRVRQQLLEHRQLHPGRFNPDLLRFAPGAITYEGIRAAALVFCEGQQARFNPWFGQLPFQPAKGEIITLATDQPLAEAILNAGHWLIPLSNNSYRLGSNYDSQHLDDHPTTAIADALLDALNTLVCLDSPPRLLGHLAGVRPATRGAQPFIGSHPRQPLLHIFNGFGSKGSLLIPWYASRFADVLCGKGSLPDNADIHRYHDLLVADR